MTAVAYFLGSRDAANAAQGRVCGCFIRFQAARPAPQVARRRGELGLEAGLAPALVAAAPQAVPPDQFTVCTLDCVAPVHAGSVLWRLAEVTAGLRTHMVPSYVECPACKFVFF